MRITLLLYGVMVETRSSIITGQQGRDPSTSILGPAILRRRPWSAA